MATLTSAALTAHDLGLAATFGGILFGQGGLGTSVDVLPNQEDRARVLNASWRKYSIPKSVGLATAALTWFAGRSVFSGRTFGKNIRPFVIAKDISLGLTVLSGIGAQICGSLLAKEEPFPLVKEGTPAPSTPERAAKLTRLVSVFGAVQLVAAGATVALTSALHLKGHRSAVWGTLARALP